jgi:hypothetical protein
MSKEKLLSLSMLKIKVNKRFKKLKNAKEKGPIIKRNKMRKNKNMRTK